MCNSCEVLNINGINCHEIGCPDSWRDYSRTCKWCGDDFIPEESTQLVCEDCYVLCHVLQIEE